MREAVVEGECPMLSLNRRGFLKSAIRASAALGVASTAEASQDVKTPGFGQEVEVNGVKYYRAVMGGRSWPLRMSDDRSVQSFEVRAGDKGYAGDITTGNERAELVTITRGDNDRLVRFAEEYWLSFSFMIGTDAPITSTSVICGQIHDLIDQADKVPLSPPFCFVLGRSQTGDVPYFVHTRSDANLVTSRNPSPAIVYSTMLARGVFHTVVLRIRPHFERSAGIKLWINGRLVLDRDDLSIGYNNSTTDVAGYWQYGIYRGRNPNTLRLVYANMEQGHATLADRIGKPLPHSTIVP